MRDVGRLKGTTQMRSMEKRPLAQPRAMVSGKAWRFTVLTPALIRVEYDAEGSFNDAPTQTVLMWLVRLSMGDALPRLRAT